jgi:hypothetical protein
MCCSYPSIYPCLIGNIQVDQTLQHNTTSFRLCRTFSPSAIQQVLDASNFRRWRIVAASVQVACEDWFFRCFLHTDASHQNRVWRTIKSAASMLMNDDLWLRLVKVDDYSSSVMKTKEPQKTWRCGRRELGENPGWENPKAGGAAKFSNGEKLDKFWEPLWDPYGGPCEREWGEPLKIKRPEYLMSLLEYITYIVLTRGSHTNTKISFRFWHTGTVTGKILPE